MVRGFGKAGAAAAKPWSTQLDLFDDFMPTPATVTPVVMPVASTVDGLGFDLEDLKSRFEAVRIVPVQSPWFGNDVALGLYSGDAKMSKWSWMHTFSLYCLGGRVHTIHPAFDDAPWLQPVAEALGYSPTYDDRLRLRRREAEQRFAWEFVSDKTTDELLAHQHLTTPLAIVTAVAGALGRHKPIEADMKLSYENARMILIALGAEEPELGDYSDAEMIDAVVTRDYPQQSELLDVTWRRIHAWQLELVRYQKGTAVSVYDLEAAA